MPAPAGSGHHSTISYYHFSKVAVMKSKCAAAGCTIASGWACRSPDGDYRLHLATARLRPQGDPRRADRLATNGIASQGVDAVLAKYKRGRHQSHRQHARQTSSTTTRGGSNSVQSELARPAAVGAASNSVQAPGPGAVFKDLIAQRKLTPLNVFLDTAPAQRAERAMINLDSASATTRRRTSSTRTSTPATTASAVT